MDSNHAWRSACLEIIDRCVAPDMYGNARALLDKAMHEASKSANPDIDALTRDEMQECVDLLAVDHTEDDFEPECPACTARVKIQSWLSVARSTHPTKPPTSLAAEDYQAIRAQLCEAHPGDWLHHYGPAVEAEVLKRLRATV